MESQLEWMQHVGAIEVYAGLETLQDDGYYWIFEVCLGGVSAVASVAVRTYTIYLSSSRPYARMKLMIVGVQGIGKTSLLEQLRQEGTASTRKPNDVSCSS